VIVLDASVMIGYLDAGDLHHERAEQLLDRAAQPLAISTGTLAEVLVGPTRAGQERWLGEILSDLDVTEVLGPEGSAPALARLRVDTGLRLPDCCVLLAARSSGAAVATFDARLAAAAASLGLLVLDG